MVMSELTLLTIDLETRADRQLLIHALASRARGLDRRCRDCTSAQRRTVAQDWESLRHRLRTLETRALFVDRAPVDRRAVALAEFRAAAGKALRAAATLERRLASVRVGAAT